MLVREIVTRLAFNVDAAKLQRFDRAIGSAVDKTEALTKNLRRVGEAVRNVGTKMTLGVTLPLAAGLGFGVKFASDMQEAENAARVAFGDMEDEAIAFGDQFAKQFGRTRKEIYDSIGTFQSFFVGMKASQEEAFKLNKELQPMIQDFASIKNLDPADTMQRFMSGISGEIEPLRRFGVNLSATNVELKLQELGLAKSSKEATQYQKAIARVAIIREVMGSTGMMGDALRTQKQFANALRRFTSRIQEAAASFGELLLPVLEKLLNVIIPIVNKIVELPTWIKYVILAFAGLVAMIGPLLILLGTFIILASQAATAMSLMTLSAGATGTGGLVFSLARLKFMLFSMLTPLKAFAANAWAAMAPFLPWIALIAAVGAALWLLWDDISIWRQGGDSLIGKILGPWEHWRDAMKALIDEVKAWFLLLKSAMLGVFDAVAEKLEPFKNDVRDAFSGVRESIKNALPSTVRNAMSEQKGIEAKDERTFRESLLGFVGRSAAAAIPFGSATMSLVGAAKKGPGAIQRVVDKSIQIRSNITVSVPEGTPESQAQYVREAARQAAEETFNRQVNHVLNANESDVE